MDEPKSDQPDNEPKTNSSPVIEPTDSSTEIKPGKDSTEIKPTSGSSEDEIAGGLPEPETPASPLELPPELPETPKDAEVSADTSAPVGPDAPAVVGQQSHPKAGATGFLKNKKDMLAVGLAVLVLLAGGAYYMMNNKSKTTDNSTTASAPVKKVIPLLRFGSQNGMITQFYPGDDSTTSTSSYTINLAVFEGLVGYGDNGKFTPLLATSWTNPDDNTWVFKLASGVKFHDGNTMTAQNVKDSILASTPNGDLFNISTTVKSIDVVDANTVKITTVNPDPLLLNQLAGMYIFDTNSKNVDSPDNGTGPYIVKPGTTYDYNGVDLVPFADYHGPQPLVKEIVGKGYTDDAALDTAAKNNQVDVAFTFFKSQAADVSSVNKDFKFQQIPTLGAYNLSPLTMKPGSPVQKLDVRKAMYLTLDPTAIMAAAGKDGDPIGQIVPKNVAGYDPTIVRPKQDIAMAKTLMTQAGYPNGTTLSIFYGPPADKTAHEIGKELAQIGITLTYDPVTTFSQYVDNIKTNRYDLAYISSYSDVDEISDLISQGLSKGGQLDTYDNPAVDALLAQALQQFDTTKRIQLLQQASETIMNDVGTIPIFSPNSQVLLRKNYYAPFNVPDGQFGAYLAQFYAQ